MSDPVFERLYKVTSSDGDQSCYVLAVSMADAIQVYNDAKSCIRLECIITNAALENRRGIQEST